MFVDIPPPCVSYILLYSCSDILENNFSLGSPLWEDSNDNLLDSSSQAGAGQRKRKRFTLTTGPTQPAFIQLSFASHEQAWAAYRVLATHKDTPGYVSWVYSKHYRWVRQQTESFKKISTPMLVDSFFRKGKNGGIKIIPDLRDEFSTN